MKGLQVVLGQLCLKLDTVMLRYFEGPLPTLIQLYSKCASSGGNTTTGYPSSTDGS